MPFQSKNQAKYLFARKPKIAQEFASKTKGMHDLPKHKKMDKKKMQMEAMKRKMK